MHVNRFLHNLLGGVIHKKRVEVLSEVVMAAIMTKKLTLTALGRGLRSKIQERSGIQKVNRLLGNKHMKEDYCAITKQIAELTIGSRAHPDIIVDWTKYPNSDNAVLRAALSARGRAITLYEERHSLKKMGNGKIQKKFLHQLAAIIPTGCQPTIITDAGFHNDWFREVVGLGWHYIGRIRGLRRYCELGKIQFMWCSDWFKKATQEAQSLGKMILTRKNPLETSFYIIKNKLKGRKALTKQGKVRRDQDSKNYGRAHREPWLLASSFSGRQAAKKVCRTYARRMTIEEGIRDLKSSRYGFGLEQSKTKLKERRDVLLLIGMLAAFIAWVTGYVAETRGLHYQFQSNSIKHRRVLSLVYLGCQVIKKKLLIPLSSIHKAMASLPMEEGYV